MQLPTITADPAEALRKHQAYLNEQHADAYDFSTRCAAAYEALQSGRALISLSAAIRAGGLDDNGRPRLAVARADRKEVYMSWRRGDEIIRFCSAAQPHRWSAGEWPALNRFVNMKQTHQDPQRWQRSGYALVPAVPADVRPKTGQLSAWFILWEVEHWSETSMTAQPPTDPYLLEHIGGDLYVIIAQWDLTDLERAIMADIAEEARRRQP